MLYSSGPQTESSRIFLKLSLKAYIASYFPEKDRNDKRGATLWDPYYF